MVRALLDGTKTQTRRAFRDSPPPGVNVGIVNGKTRYGSVGDRLWVREHWRAPASCDHLPPRSISDSEPLRFIADEVTGPDAGFGKARRAFHMPRWASRISLEITRVRVERLQDISDGDSIAEGVQGTRLEDVQVWRDYLHDGKVFLSARHSYISLWESINGPESWDANPWVWVVEFKVVKP